MFKRVKSKNKFLKVEPTTSSDPSPTKKPPTEFPDDDEEDVPPPTIDMTFGEDPTTSSFDVISVLKGFVLPLVSPLVTAAISVGGAELSLLWENQYLILLYPYMIVLLNFAGALPSLLQSFNSATLLIFSVMDQFMEAYENTMKLYMEKIVTPIHKLETAIQEALEPMRPKLDKFTKLESKLQKINPNIDIPDASDLEDEMDAAEGKVTSKFKDIEKSLDIPNMIPVPFRSKAQFNKYIVYPILIVYLSIMFYLAFAASRDVTNTNNENPSTDMNPTVSPYLRGSAISIRLEENLPILSDLPSPPPPIPLPPVAPTNLLPSHEQLQAQLHTIIRQCLYTSLAVLLTMFLATLKIVLQKGMKWQLERTKHQLEEQLELKLAPLNEKVLETTTTIKDKFRELEEKIEKVEDILPFGF